VLFGRKGELGEDEKQFAPLEYTLDPYTMMMMMMETMDKK
jgi:hypothetical protein